MWLTNLAQPRFRGNNLPASHGELQRKPSLPMHSFLCLLCGFMVPPRDILGLSCPLALQICNMLNAPADEYFTFQVTLPSARPCPSALPAHPHHPPPRRPQPQSLPCAHVARRNTLKAYVPFTLAGPVPPSSRFFREGRTGEGRRGVREGDRVFVIPAFGVGGSLPLFHSFPLLVIQGLKQHLAHHRCSVSVLCMSDQLYTYYHLDSALWYWKRKTIGSLGASPAVRLLVLSFLLQHPGIPLPICPLCVPPRPRT